MLKPKSHTFDVLPSAHKIFHAHHRAGTRCAKCHGPWHTVVLSTGAGQQVEGCALIQLIALRLNSLNLLDPTGLPHGFDRSGEPA